MWELIGSIMEVGQFCNFKNLIVREAYVFLGQMIDLIFFLQPLW